METDLQLEEVIRRSPVVVHPDAYAVAQVKRTPSGRPHFAVSHDESEITVLTTLDRATELEAIRIESPFALIEFQVAIPFEAPGFLARICSALAEGGINVLVFSTFSRDYVLVRCGDSAAAIEKLRAIGFTVSNRPPSAPPPTGLNSAIGGG